MFARPAINCEPTMFWKVRFFVRERSCASTYSWFAYAMTSPCGPASLIERLDVFAIQDEISRGIINSLRLKLGGGQRRYNTNVEAYDLYLQARQLIDRAEQGGVARSIELFEKVLSKDPSFAPAYAGLAKVYALRSS